ncbi:MAG: putative amidase [Promethearchaeota archaeon]|jgi:aspartyl-tRNA(Asn)/glutamyl-tRNA(Gln) amidotransferase subunit A|nr:MAG: putative amidase [Candidatus Lokiarchaeota archaeon]
MNSNDICYLSAYEMREKIKTQELTSLQITEAIIERIEKFNDKINAYCTPTFDIAREIAKQADKAVKQGKDLPPLHGIPTSIKDLVLTKGIRTTFGCVLYESNVPEVDEVVIERLKNAGMVLLGKTNTPAFGHQAVTDNPIFGKTRNPWNIERTSGGSSGGAGASVASGMGPLALGSDGGGSIRIPSSFCGVYGLKPSYGRIPHYPSAGIKWTGLDHYGPIVRYVKDAALMLDVMAGPFAGDRHSLPKTNITYFDIVDIKPKNLKIGYSFDLGFIKAVDPEVEKAVMDSVQKFDEFGWQQEKIKMKLKRPEMTFNTLVTAGLAHDLEAYLEEWQEKMSPNLVRMVQAGLTYSAVDLERAMYQRKLIHEEIFKQFQKYDVLITPSTAVYPFELGKMFPSKIAGKRASPVAWMSFTFPFNLTGNPAASIPCGWSSEGTPIGMQIVGKQFDEETVLQVSKTFEELQPWQEKKPDLK